MDDQQQSQRVFSIEHLDELEDTPDPKRERFQQAWAACEPIIQDVLYSQNARILDRVAAYLLSATIPEQSQFLAFSTSQPIPTAVVLGGSPTTLSGLNDAWPEDARVPLLARLNARDATNLKSTLRTLITRLIASGQALYTPDVGTSNAIKGKKPSMLSDDNFELFLTWYTTNVSHLEDTPKVVISLEDFEAFDPTILEDLVHILSRYRASLPIVLLFGVQTSVDAVNVLPYASKPLLRLQTFALQSGETTLMELFQAVLINHTMPLSITARVFEAIRDQFNDTDRSILTVVAKLRYIYLLHFEMLPVSMFTLPIDKTKRPDYDGLFDLCALPSFKTMADNMVNMDVPLDKNFIQAGSGSHDARIKLVDESRDIREDFEKQRRVALAAYKVFCLIFKSSRNEQLVLDGDQLSGLLSGELLDKANEALNLFRKATQDTLSTTLRYLLNDLEDHPDASNDFVKGLQTALQDFEDLCRRFQAERVQGKHSRQQLNNTRQLEGLSGSGRKGQQSASQATELDKEFTGLVQRVAEQLEILFGSGFRDPKTILLNELWYFDDPDQIQQAFHPNMLGGAEDALHPKEKCNRFLLPYAAQEDFAKSDMSTTHRLYQDAGKMVNLDDWYQSFAGARPFPAEKRRKAGRGKKRKQTEQQQGDQKEHITEEQDAQRKARFVRAVSDLAWLGFVHGTKRKPEHVAKVVF